MAGDFASVVSELGLGEHREFLMGIARPCVEIFTAKAQVTKGCSKFGGAPDLPTGFVWPHHKLGSYRFIGQFNLAEIPKGLHALPTGGLLSFFYADDEKGDSFWGDPDYVRVYLFDNSEVLQPVEPPANVRFGSTVSLKFQLGTDVPKLPWWDKSVLKKWPLSESQHDAYEELRDRCHPRQGRGHLLGYPFNTTLAYDPTPGPEWRSLLTLSSDDELQWCWHDGDWLVTFIEERRLMAVDFSQIKSDAG